MKPSFSGIRHLDLTELKSIHRKYMRRDFPRMELRPYRNMAALYRQGRYAMYGFFETDTLLGYACLIPAKNGEYALLDYFAVVDGRRGHGIGSSFLKLLMPEIPATHGVFIESENPSSTEDMKEQEIRQRRISFYERNGAVPTGHNCLLFGVDYKLLFLPRNGICADKAKFASAIETMYQEIFLHVPERVCKLRTEN